jgi:hypothetical protein
MCVGICRKVGELGGIALEKFQIAAQRDFCGPFLSRTLKRFLIPLRRTGQVGQKAFFGPV